MYKRLIMVILFVALMVGVIFLVYPEKACGDCSSELVSVPEVDMASVETNSAKAEKISTITKKEQAKPDMASVKTKKGELQSHKTVNKEVADEESPGVKYDGDYRNDLLTHFMQDDFEQFMEAKNLQVNNVRCEDAVCDIDFYSTVPLNNDEGLRNDLILDIAIKLQSNGLLSEQNQISDADNNFENIRFTVKMDEGS